MITAPASSTSPLSSAADMLAGVVAAVRALGAETEFATGVKQALANVGTYARLDRVAFFRQIEEEGGVKLHTVWSAPGVPPAEPYFGNGRILRHEDFPEVMSLLLKGENYQSIVRERSGENKRLNDAVATQSDLIVPIFVAGVFWGCVGFDDCHMERRWREDEVRVLEVLAAAIAAAAQRDATQRAKDEMEARREQAEQTLLQEREQCARQRAAEFAKANEALRRSVDRLSAAQSITAVMDAFVIESVRVTGANAGAILQRIRDTTEFTFDTVAQSDGLLSKEVSADFVRTLREISRSDPVGFFRRIIEGELIVITVEELRTWYPIAADFHDALGNVIVWNIPFEIGSQVVGYLGLAFTTPREATCLERETLAALAAQACMALETARLAQAAREADVARERERAAHERAAELAKANAAISRTLTRLVEQTDLKSFLDEILLEAVRQFDAGNGVLITLEEATDQLRLVAFAEDGRIVTSDALVTEVPSAEVGFFQKMRETRRPTQLDVERDAHLFWPGATEHLRARGQLRTFDFPLCAGEHVFGVLAVAFPRSTPISDQQSEFMAALANQASLAIQLTRLAETARGEAELAATLTERNRISRDLHDTLAQGFAGVLTQLGAAEGAAEVGDAEQMRHCHERARQLASLSLAEARSSVYALREETAALPLKERCARMFAAMTAGTNIRVSVEQNGTPPSSPLSPAIDWCVHKFAQEALANSLKHSKSPTFTFHLDWSSNSLKATALDEGLGFNSETVAAGLGHRSMYERAAEVSGSLEIFSTQGEGTRLILTVPTTPDTDPKPPAQSSPKLR